MLLLKKTIILKLKWQASLAVILITTFFFASLSYAKDSYVDSSKQTTSEPNKLHIATTFTILQDITQNIVGEKGVVVSITKPGAEIHDYEPTPKDIQKILNSDLIVYNGLNLEAWFDKFYQDIANIPIVVASESITPLYVLYEQGESTLIENPHAWMSPKNALIYVENIKNALIAIDPGNKLYYEQNAMNYSTQIKQIARNFKLEMDALQIAPEQKWLVTSEGAFSYLAEDFQLKEAYIYPIISEGQIKPKQLSRLIDVINQHNIPVIFSENTTSDRPAKTISEETNARYGGALFVDALSDNDGEVPTYLLLLETTLNRIADGFKTQNRKE